MQLYAPRHDTVTTVHKLQNSGKRYKKLVTTLKIDGKNVDFEVDTGAELSTIPANVYYNRLQKVKLQPSSIILHQYDGTALPTMGEIVAEVTHSQQKVKGRFIVVENMKNQLPLLGRDWLPTTPGLAKNAGA